MKKHYRKNSIKRTNRRIKTPVKIYVEGQTEISYFKHLNDLEYFTNLAIKTVKGPFEKFIYDTNELKYIIVDIDNKQPKQRKESDKLTQITKDERVFFNNYSFETWLLLHKNKNVKKVLKHHSYDLEMKRTYNVISWSENKSKKQLNKINKQISKKDIKAAINNSKVIENHIPFTNPSSNMKKLFDELSRLNMKGRNNV